MHSSHFLGGWYPLYTVHTGFKAKLLKSSLSMNLESRLFVSMERAFRFIDWRPLPPLDLGVLFVHERKLFGKERRFLTSRTRPHFKNELIGQLLFSIFLENILHLGK